MANRPEHALARRPEHAFADGDLAAAYRRTFTQGDGKLVLEDLMQRFYDGQIDVGGDLSRFIGRRDVMLHIKQTVEEGDGPSTS